MRENYNRKFPKDTERIPTGCQYCAVGCGYNAFVIPDNETQGEEESTAQHGVARQITPAMRNDIRFRGKPVQAAVVPDSLCDLNKGNHSVRGGSQGGNLVSTSASHRSTKARLKSPQVRLANGELTDITWDTLYSVLSRLITETVGIRPEGDKLHVSEPHRLGVKLFEYQYLENTFAATKLFYSAIGTPNVAFHDRPSAAGSSPALKDVGFAPHDFAYEDLRQTDVIFMIGTNPYENQSVAFMQYMAGKEIIVMDPRKTATAQYAESTGGLHVQPDALGADSLVIYAIAREILYQNSDWDVSGFDVGSTEERESLSDGTPSKRRRKLRAMSFDEFKLSLGLESDADDAPTADNAAEIYSLENASSVSGIDAQLLQQVVERLSRQRKFGQETRRPRVAILYEKGIIWGFNYSGIAAIGSLGLLLGAYSNTDENGNLDSGNGCLVGRVGGHQKGWAMSNRNLNSIFTSGREGYPNDRNDVPIDSYSEAGQSIELKNNIDLHVFGAPKELLPDDDDGTGGTLELKNRVTTVRNPDVKLLWIVGGNYFGQTNDSQRKIEQLKSRLSAGGEGGEIARPTSVNETEILEVFRNRLKHDDGLIIVHQELFANPTSEFCDLLIPAAGWGEDNFTRYNAQRRLKLYGRFQDMPLHESDQQWFEKKGLVDRDPMKQTTEDHQPILRLEQLEHSPRPDWMIFRDVARYIGALTDGNPKPENRPENRGHFEDRLRSEFKWGTSAHVADDMAVWSHRGVASTNKGKASMLGDLFLYGREKGLDTEAGILHTLLGATEEWTGNEKGPRVSDKLVEGYEVKDSQINSNGIATNGVLLPVVGISSNDEVVNVDVRVDGVVNATEVLKRQKAIAKLNGTLRVAKSADNPRFFIRAPWSQIETAFKRVNEPAEQSDRILVTNGRFNHLWNNMFHHIRNDYVNERWPEDLPGTVLEIAEDWVNCQVDPNDPEDVPIENGQIVDVTTAEGNSFRAVASIQASVATDGKRGVAFALFSYPIIGSNDQPAKGEAAFLGQANRVSDGYFDGIHPIAALKYSVGKVTKAKNPATGKNDWFYPRHFETQRSGPTFAERNQITRGPSEPFPNDPFTDEDAYVNARAIWEMRELIVTKGLPRAFVQRDLTADSWQSEGHDLDIGKMMERPDSFIRELNDWIFAANQFRNMDTRISSTNVDSWSNADIEVVETFIALSS